MSKSKHHVFMAHALRLAANGLNTTDPNPRVGCVIVKGADIVGTGWHERAGSAHAEVNALNEAGEKARGATVYVTLEPCSHYGRTPPCADTLIKAGIAEVVLAMRDPNPLVGGEGIERLQQAGVAVTEGILEAAARALNPGFIKRMERGLPYVRVKMGASLDGQTAMASGESQWITGSEARRDVQRLRARSSAVMTGIGTVLADDPSLNVRPQQLNSGIEKVERQPMRVIIDSHFRTPATAKILSLPGDVLLVGAHQNAAYQALVEKGHGTQLVEPTHDGRVSLVDALRKLGALQCNELLVEAGANLTGALLLAGLVDELVLYLAPCIIGGEGRPLAYLPGLERLQDRVKLEITETRSIGTDLRINAIVSALQN